MNSRNHVAQAVFKRNTQLKMALNSQVLGLQVCGPAPDSLIYISLLTLFRLVHSIYILRYTCIFLNEYLCSICNFYFNQMIFKFDIVLCLRFCFPTLYFWWSIYVAIYKVVYCFYVLYIYCVLCHSFLAEQFVSKLFFVVLYIWIYELYIIWVDILIIHIIYFDYIPPASNFLVIQIVL